MGAQNNSVPVFMGALDIMHQEGRGKLHQQNPWQHDHLQLLNDCEVILRKVLAATQLTSC